jgi:erythronate-4-phosphate dehydrogenase
MKIVADSNIPFAAEACAGLGEVEILKASDLSAERLRDCGVLLCRSTRKIDAKLLDGTAVRFVATATIGVDHVDLDYLQARGIGFASAPGSNANSVSEYIASVLVVMAHEMARPLRDMTIGVVGVGNVGRRVVTKAEALGMTVLQNDPPLERQTGDARFRPVEELMDADVITLHVPLEREGKDATYHMVDETFLGRMKPGAMLINSARGAVADGGALNAALCSGKMPAVVLDVWEHEPDIDVDLVANAALGTPHIAGHSFDGKVNGTKMVVDAACEFLGVRAVWTPEAVMPPPEIPRIELDVGGRDDEDVIREAVLALYDVRRDDSPLRRIPKGGSRGEYFSKLRREYWPRRAFHNTTVAAAGASPGLLDSLSGLGFRLEG